MTYYNLVKTHPILQLVKTYSVRQKLVKTHPVLQKLVETHPVLQSGENSPHITIW
jgi:hypothetical protein